MADIFDFTMGIIGLKIVGLVVVFGITCFLLDKVFYKSNSKKYRELLSDMYVVGMIKKFAEEDNIDLLKEIREFILVVKKEKMSEKDLDKAIEMHLNEKIAEKTQEKFK